MINQFNNNKTIFDNDEFHYGQAQKWLNMTIKNMRIMGLWDSIIDRHSEVLHIPVDNAVIKGAWEYNDVPLPTKKDKLLKDGSRGKYSDEKRIAWSKWNDNDYTDFQYSMRDYFDKSLKQEYDSLEAWENYTWMKYA